MKTMLSEEQEGFLGDIYWTVASMEILYGTDIYYPASSEADRQEFRRVLEASVRSLVLREYSEEVSSKQHIVNIKELSNATIHIGFTIRNGRLNFGVTQKLLNLYLKYLWCADFIPTPPHFPVDGVIQEISNYPLIFSWDWMFDEKKYMKFIEFADREREKNGDSSIAEWELRAFGRRVN